MTDLEPVCPHCGRQNHVSDLDQRVLENGGTLGLICSDCSQYFTWSGKTETPRDDVSRGA